MNLQTGGALGAMGTTNVPDEASHFVVGDLNGDGNGDVVAFHKRNGTSALDIGTVMGRGDGTFDTTGLVASKVSPTGTSSYFLDFGLADVNGDTKLDLLTLSQYPVLPSDGMLLGLGTGSGTFQPAAMRMACGTTMQTTMAIADLDGDQKVDVLTTPYICRGDGTGAFTQQSIFYFQAPTAYPTIIDLNGDTIPDLISVDKNYTNVALWLGKEDKTYRAGQSVMPSANSDVLRVADVNGDGHPDLVLGHLGAPNAEVRMWECN